VVDKIIHALLLLSKTLQHILDVALGEMISSGKIADVVKSHASISTKYVAEYVIHQHRIKVLTLVLEWKASLCGSYLMLFNHI
jgi:hypothetical protein